jgi:hypothetical protein
MTYHFEVQVRTAECSSGEPRTYELRVQARPGDVAHAESTIDEALSSFDRDSTSRAWRRGGVMIHALSYDGRVPELSLLLDNDGDGDEFVDTAYRLSEQLGYEVYVPELGSAIPSARRGEIFENMADLLEKKEGRRESVAAMLLSQGWGSMLFSLAAATAIAVGIVVYFEIPRQFPLIATISTVVMLFISAAAKRR